MSTVRACLGSHDPALVQEAPIGLIKKDSTKVYLKRFRHCITRSKSHETLDTMMRLALLISMTPFASILGRRALRHRGLWVRQQAHSIALAGGWVYALLGWGGGGGLSIFLEEEEEVSITSGNWRGKHNSLSRGAGADQP